MSERMIELQRAKLGLPPIASGQPNATTQLLTAPGGITASSQAQLSAQAQYAAAAPRQPQMTPQQMAVAAVHAQEAQLQTFLQRLHERSEDGASTVPTALSRRMLQRQGVGYLDDTVASIVSANADRFLATVLQQAVVCRNQRLKGNEMALQEERRRRKHVLQHQADADDRKRRKLAKENKLRMEHLQALAAADRLKAAGLTPPPPANGNNTTAATAAAANRNRKKKKKGDNGSKSDDEDDYMSDDSLEQEEQYYKDYYGDGNDAASDDEEDNENQDMLTLRDLERPLEAWDVHLTGKVGLGVVVAEEEASDEENSENEEEEKAEDMDVEMNGNGQHKVDDDGDDASQASTPAKKATRSPTPKGDNKAMDGRKSTTPTNKKAGSKAPSPVPPSKS